MRLDYTRRAGGPEGDFCAGIVSHAGFSVKTDATERQRRHEFVSKRSRTQKVFVFSLSERVQFLKKVETASYPSRGFFVNVSSNFSKSVPNS